MGRRTLARYIHDPKDAIPGKSNGLSGIKNEQEMENLLAYLKEATK